MKRFLYLIILIKHMRKRKDRNIKKSNKSNIPKTNKWYKNVHVWADIVTIFSIIFALWVFGSNQCYQQRQSVDEYTNQLESLKAELELNHIYRTKLLLDGKEGYLNATNTPGYRYYTMIINKLLAEGKIRDNVLKDKLYSIGSREDNANTVLDGAFLVFHTVSLINGTKEGVIFRVKEDNKIAVERAEELNILIPETIELIKKHITEINSEFNSSLCFIWK
ncbi:hypothetical protein COV14_02420 [Candidatus Woesearchaeota archaeon CG10_big_fil_rev_8_21_14_0_10_33_12]|nr:MAG: hypothetical protein COV14_02420 [Candidatus Woesearchaeota archaeon CG10_big_fil_rev_8_21_14_0_10_33_12]